MRIAFVIAGVSAGLLGAPTHAAAQEQSDYPLRPVRVVVPNAPGSTTDLLGRIVFTRMSERLGKQLGHAGTADDRRKRRAGVSLLRMERHRGAAGDTAGHHYETEPHDG